MIRLALAQIDPVVGDLAGNRELILGCIEQAKDAKADIVVFPELATTGYPPEDLLLRPGFLRATAESLGLPTQRRESGVWIMNAGTSTAHIMIPGR